MSFEQNTEAKAKADNSEYNKALEEMIEMNKRLEESFKSLKGIVGAMNGAFDDAMNKASKFSGTADKTMVNIEASSGAFKEAYASVAKELEEFKLKRAIAFNKAKDEFEKQSKEYQESFWKFEKVKEARNFRTKFQKDFFKGYGIDDPTEIMADISNIKHLFGEDGPTPDKYTELFANLSEFKDKYTMFGIDDPMDAIDVIDEIFENYKTKFAEMSAIYKDVDMNMKEPLKPEIDTSEVEKLDKMIEKLTSKLADIAKNESDTIKGIVKMTGDDNKRVKTSESRAEAVKFNLSKNINDILGKTSGSAISGLTGSSSLGKIAGNLISKLVTIGKTGKTAGTEAATGISLIGKTLVSVLGKLAGFMGIVAVFSKLGKDAYKTTVDMTQSFRQLGEGAGQAFAYAKKLNEDFNVSLSSTLGNLSKVAVSMRSLGMNTEQSTNVAVTSEALSRNIAYAWGEQDIDKVRSQFMDALGGGSGLEYTGAFTSDNVMAAWLSATKGINMYATKISDAQMEAYRLEKIVEDLNKVSLSTGETLTNLTVNMDSTWARNQRVIEQLNSMREKLSAIWIPLYQGAVQVGSYIVDVLYKAINGVLKLLGKDTLKLTSDVLVDESALSSVYDLNSAYSQTGEKIKEAKNQLLGFDELISMSAVQTLDDSNGLDIADNKKLTGTGVDFKTGVASLDKINKELDDSIKKTKTLERQAIEAFKDGNIGDGLKKLLFGNIGSFTGLSAIQGFVDGRPLDGIANASQTIAFWFGGIPGKVSLIATELMEATGEALGLDDGLVDILITVTSVATRIGGWKGLIISAGAALTVFGAQLGSIAGQKINQAISSSVGASGTWGKFQSWDSRTAANMLYGKGTPEAEAEYYRLMHEKFGEDADIPKYEYGGIAMRPQVAKIAEAGYPELVQPLGGPVAQQFYDNIADAVRSVGAASGNPTSINVTIPVSNMFATNYELKQLSDIMADYLAEALRNRGALDSGVII